MGDVLLTRVPLSRREEAAKQKNQRDFVCALVCVWTLITNRVGCERLEAVPLCFAAFTRNDSICGRASMYSFQRFQHPCRM
jgi:hypothetical protein